MSAPTSVSTLPVACRMHRVQAIETQFKRLAVTRGILRNTCVATPRQQARNPHLVNDRQRPIGYRAGLRLCGRHSDGYQFPRQVLLRQCPRRRHYRPPCALLHSHEIETITLYRAPKWVNTYVLLRCPFADERDPSRRFGCRRPALPL